MDEVVDAMDQDIDMMPLLRDSIRVQGITKMCTVQFAREFPMSDEFPISNVLVKTCIVEKMMFFCAIQVYCFNVFCVLLVPLRASKDCILLIKKAQYMKRGQG